MNDSAFHVSIPRLTTRRLLLRELRRSDFDAYAEHMTDPVAMAHPFGVVDRRTAWRQFAASTGAWLLNGAGWWAIELRATGEFAGCVGAFFRETSFDGNAPADLELGWSVFPRFWRQGFASEAASAALAHGMAAHKVKRVIAYIDPTNLASIGVSQRLGMRYETDIEFYGIRTGRYAIEQP